MGQINRQTLDYLFVKLPRRNGWKKYYVRYQNSQLLLYKSVQRHDFKCSYIIYKCLVRRTRVYIGSEDVGPGDQRPKKVDALMLSHSYDDECLLLTIPEIFKMHSLGPESDLNQGPFRQELLEMLDEIAKLLSMNAINPPDMRRSPLLPGFDIDQTNKNPFGKVMIEIDQIKQFP